ncbi:hypothetical protein BCV71DRAFT_273081 [Rhizopus microsporus]|uniref:Uncharacterized protein n=1 Tax=Rhizopus microsporus TaxID=58291 RepID=A0A1X0SCL6_RHIZD|nr:hypothetical protein BCV71DRAFT_273081 [Rhizopus microsporus]
MPFREEDSVKLLMTLSDSRLIRTEGLRVEISTEGAYSLFDINRSIYAKNFKWGDKVQVMTYYKRFIQGDIRTHCQMRTSILNFTRMIVFENVKISMNMTNSLFFFSIFFEYTSSSCFQFITMPVRHDHILRRISTSSRVPKSMDELLGQVEVSSTTATKVTPTKVFCQLQRKKVDCVQLNVSCTQLKQRVLFRAPFEIVYADLEDPLLYYKNERIGIKSTTITVATNDSLYFTSGREKKIRI